MSREVCIYSYDYENLKKEIASYCKIKNDKELNILDRILEMFGTKLGDKYIILRNEVWINSDCYYNLPVFLNQYFKCDDVFGNVFCSPKKSIKERELVSASSIEDACYFFGIEYLGS